jgi:hypothetical protein
MVYCDYKRSCKNKGSRCGNCERNYKNEIWEDNYEPMERLNRNKTTMKEN